MSNLQWHVSRQSAILDLAFLKDLLEAGKIVQVIERRYPLSECAEALRYLAEGHSQGKVVITV